MKQIGARQEAGRIGGTGPCGRELCCATWMKNFVSVSTNAARFQDISLNPQKLAGMCAKLKCCLNYEVDTYVEASRKIPAKDIVLQTADGDYYQFKTDILAGQITYSSDKNLASNLETISADRAKEIILMNRQGEKPLSLLENGKAKPTTKSTDLLAEADLSRFDKNKKKKKKNNTKPRNNRPNGEKGERNNLNGANATINNEQGQTAQQGQAQQNNQQGDRQESRPQGERQDKQNNRRENNRRNDNRPPRNNRPPKERKPQGERPQNSNRQNAQQEKPQPSSSNQK